jgi:ribosomal protein S18 acetylase RimI-like enzyme
MPEIEIRPATDEDYENLVSFEHGYYTDYVWQMGLEANPESAQVEFRRIRLPRRVFVSYPRERHAVLSDVDQAEALLLAISAGRPVGYIKILAQNDRKIARISDLVISGPMRRQGIASGLLLASLDLSAHRHFRTVILEIQSKNDPAIQMAQKLGFNFCGFKDHYFPNGELALFYSRFAR